MGVPAVNDSQTTLTPEHERNPETTTQATIEARAISKVYQTDAIEVPALKRVDLSLYAGELVVLLGPSGSGKSTLLNILGGLDRPSTGQVFFKGSELTRFDDDALTLYRRDQVGFVFQFYNLVSSLTARENVDLVTEISRDPMAAEEALALVGLSERMNHFPAELSGGEQQRVAIARAIAKRPGILMCDEPTGALDSQTGIVVLEALAATNKELGTTTAIITHNAVVADMADRVIRLADGEVAEIYENKTRKEPKELSW